MSDSKTKNYQGYAPAASSKKAGTMTVRVMSVTCPNCGDEQTGWLVDPRGRDHQCDNCSEMFHVPDGVEVKVF